MTEVLPLNRLLQLALGEGPMFNDVHAIPSMEGDDLIHRQKAGGGWNQYVV